MSRAFWFLVGAGTGVYAVVRTRRAAERFTASGIGDQAGALAVGARLFRDEVLVNMGERESQLREHLGVLDAGHPTEQANGQLTGHPTGHSTGHPTGHSTGHPNGQPTGHPTGQPTGQPARATRGLARARTTGRSPGGDADRSAITQGRERGSH